MLRHGVAFVQEFASARKYLQGFRSCHALDDPNRSAESQMQVEFLPVTLGRGRQRAGQLDTMCEVLDRLDHGRAPKSALTGLVPVTDSDIEEASLRIVMRQRLRLRYGDFREMLLQHPPDTRMKNLALATQQCAVGSVLDERVLGHEGRSQRGASTKDQAGAGELFKRISKFVV